MRTKLGSKYSAKRQTEGMNWAECVSRGSLHRTYRVHAYVRKGGDCFGLCNRAWLL